MYQQTSPTKQEREEGNIFTFQINPQGSNLAEFNVTPPFDEYDSDRESSDVQLPQSLLWEAAQEEEASKEAPTHDAYISHGEQDQEPPPSYETYYSEDDEMVVEV